MVKIGVPCSVFVRRTFLIQATATVRSQDVQPRLDAVPQRHHAAKRTTCTSPSSFLLPADAEPTTAHWEPTLDLTCPAWIALTTVRKKWVGVEEQGSERRKVENTTSVWLCIAQNGFGDDHNGTPAAEGCMQGQTGRRSAPRSRSDSVISNILLLKCSSKRKYKCAELIMASTVDIQISPDKSSIVTFPSRDSPCWHE
jgi:hypothetical protein